MVVIYYNHLLLHSALNRLYFVHTGLFKPIDYIRLVSVSPGQLVFKWSPVCPLIQYSISTSNCGECVYNNTTSNATCSIPQLGTTSSICTFSIQSAVCSNSFNDSLEVTIKGNVSDYYAWFMVDHAKS